MEAEVSLTIERVLPHSFESERIVIGSILAFQNSRDELMQKIKNYEYFYAPNHQIIFAKVQEMDAAGEEIDYAMVFMKLNLLGKAEDIGGITYFSDLSTMGAFPAVALEHAEILEDLYIRRKSIALNQMTLNEFYTSDEKAIKIAESQAENILQLTSQKLSDSFRTAKTLVSSRVEQYKAAASVKEEERAIVLAKTFLLSGFSSINQMAIGYGRKDLVILAARPAMGKTSWIAKEALEIAKRDEPVLFVSMEMSGEQMMDRLISIETEIPYQRLISGALSKDEWNRVAQAELMIKELPLIIDDSGDCTPAEIRAKAKQLKALYGKIAAIIIDYLQLMSSGIAKKENRTIEISDITRALKKLAMALNVVIFALSQLSRKVEERQNKRPMLSDLRESGSIEQDADKVFFIYRDEYYNPDSAKKKVSELIVAKHRNGPVGTIEQFFEAAYVGFSDLEKAA